MTAPQSCRPSFGGSHCQRLFAETVAAADPNEEAPEIGKKDTCRKGPVSRGTELEDFGSPLTRLQPSPRLIDASLPGDVSVGQEGGEVLATVRIGSQAGSPRRQAVSCRAPRTSFSGTCAPDASFLRGPPCRFQPNFVSLPHTFQNVVADLPLSRQLPIYIAVPMESCQPRPRCVKKRGGFSRHKGQGSRGKTGLAAKRDGGR